MKSSVGLFLILACGLSHASVSQWHKSDTLAIRKVEVLTGNRVCWKRVELRIDATGTYTTPFDQDEIAIDASIRTPSGKTMHVPAFFYQAFQIDKKDRSVPAGAPEWRLRFTPVESGTYSVQISARDHSGSVASPAIEIAVRPAPGHGYIRVSEKDPHYFEFDDGTPYFAIGENLCWGALADFERWMPRLAENGATYSRLWLGNGKQNVETNAPAGEYRLDHAWTVDQIIELAERYGIYEKVSIEAFRNLSPEGVPDKHGPGVTPNPYTTASGGPCRTMRDFFELPEARRMFRNRLRYIVARWSYSPNIMAWEMWNEFNTANVKPKEEQEGVQIPWSREMCRYLKSIDPTGRLTTTSLGSFDFWPDLWASPEHEFAQMHGYYGWHTKHPNEEEPARAWTPIVIEWLDKLRPYPKPYLWAEFGIERQFPEDRAMCDKDHEGVQMHAGIWAPAMHGAAGTGHLWWWDSYVDPGNLYFHLKSFASFAKGIPWTTAGFGQARVQSNHGKLNVLGLHGHDLTVLWIENKAHTWWNVVHDTPIPAVEGESIQVEGFPAGNYAVEYWDSWKGVPTGTKQVESAENRLTIQVPKLDRDIALKISRSK